QAPAVPIFSSLCLARPRATSWRVSSLNFLLPSSLSFQHVTWMAGGSRGLAELQPELSKLCLSLYTDASPVRKMDCAPAREPAVSTSAYRFGTDYMQAM